MATKVRKSNTRKRNRRAEVNQERVRSSMKSPLELYGTDEQAALGAWVLLVANIAPLRDPPVADSTPLAMSRSGKLLSPMSAIPTLCLDVSVFRYYCRHYTLYTLSTAYTWYVQCRSTTWYLVCIMESRGYLNSVATRRYTGRCGSG